MYDADAFEWLGASPHAPPTFWMIFGMLAEGGKRSCAFTTYAAVAFVHTCSGALSVLFCTATACAGVMGVHCYRPVTVMSSIDFCWLWVPQVLLPMQACPLAPCPPCTCLSTSPCFAPVCRWGLGGTLLCIVLQPLLGLHRPTLRLSSAQCCF